MSYKFEISLTVLEHLGRNLYRSFSTIIGEAISNAWDADATVVDITYTPADDLLIVRDNGVGMDEEDFQGKFLRIGFSKRKEGFTLTSSGRPFIGRKGLGKLALLSAAEQISIASKKEGHNLIGGTVIQEELSQVIDNDQPGTNYVLGSIDETFAEEQLTELEHGTAISLKGFKLQNKVSELQLRKLIALYFRFSLVDPSFQIAFNGTEIGPSDLDDLRQNTEFLWKTNGFADPIVDDSPGLKETHSFTVMAGVKGFIASVEKPRHLSISTTGERVSVDLFVNGRLRERNILKLIPTARIAESYLFGQIHYDGLEGEVDRFTSSREGVIADDELYLDFLDKLATSIKQITDEWDEFRRKHRKDGDPDNTQITKKARKAGELVNVVTEEFVETNPGPQKDLVDQWLSELFDDAQYNVGSYAECFVAENLIRTLINHKLIPLSPEAQNSAAKFKTREDASKLKAGLAIHLRKDHDPLGYLDMMDLGSLIDKQPNNPICLYKYADRYKPMRDACAHTGRLSNEAKIELTAVFGNIKARVKWLLAQPE